MFDYIISITIMWRSWVENAHYSVSLKIERRVMYGSDEVGNVIGSERRDHFTLNVIFFFFLPFFKLSPFQGLKSPRLLTWFIGSIGLLLHRSNVRSYSKASVPSGEPPKWNIKRRFSNEIDAAARPAHTGNSRGSEFGLASVAGWRKKIHSWYVSRD